MFLSKHNFKYLSFISEAFHRPPPASFPEAVSGRRAGLTARHAEVGSLPIELCFVGGFTIVCYGLLFDPNQHFDHLFSKISRKPDVAFLEGLAEGVLRMSPVGPFYVFNVGVWVRCLVGVLCLVSEDIQKLSRAFSGGVAPGLCTWMIDNFCVCNEKETKAKHESVRRSLEKRDCN